MKKITLLLILISSVTFSQKKKSTKIGQITQEELKMSIYTKDSLASAVVLYEHANLYLDKKNNYNFRTDYYFKIKILDKSAFEKGNVDILLYGDQKVKDVKAVTYNLESNTIHKTFLKQNQIFTTQENENWKKTSFTLPNLKKGCVIEYTYSVLSPYSQLDDWYFQSDIPKIKSEFDATLLLNYKYNTRLIGMQKLDKNNAKVKKNCIYLNGVGNGDCAAYSYGMNNIPAFKEEAYMLGKQNFISRLAFDLISFTETNGVVKKYTKTWKDADKTLRYNFLDGQTSKKKYFKKNIPSEILLEEDELTRATKVYKFVQKRMNWNEKYWTQKKLRVKRIFEEKTGSVDAINLVLYNSLQSAGIESYLVASSTRQNGLPTKLYPIVTDFNYILVKAVINGKSYFLDGTSKNLAFGEVPFRCLNGEGRVLDFEKGSYWELIKPRTKTSTNTRIQLNLDENGDIKGSMNIVKKGYNALSERIKIKSQTEEEYLDDFESKNPILEVDKHSVISNDENEEPLKQVFEVSIENDEGNTITINPFLYERTETNPFKLKERNYPVDFGFKRSFTYSLKLKIPENYNVSKVPENKAISLPNKGGRFILKAKKDNNIVFVYCKIDIFKTLYSSEEYYYLKEFYNQIIQTQQSLITLEKQN